MGEREMTMVEKVERAINALNVVFTCSEQTGLKLKWAIIQGSDPERVLFVGIEVDLETDVLGNPPLELRRVLQKLQARAAIEAMREPTQGMVKAVMTNTGLNPEQHSNVADVSDWWRFWIDAALSETPTPSVSSAYQEP